MKKKLNNFLFFKKITKNFFYEIVLKRMRREQKKIVTKEWEKPDRRGRMNLRKNFELKHLKLEL